MEGKLRLCILGCGAIARTHAIVLRRQARRVELYFASRSQSKAEAYCRRFGGRGAFSSYEEACRDEAIEAVLICTPHHLHFPQTCLALEQRKHVIVEKPMALSTREATQMNHLAQQVDRRLLVAENYRFRPSVRAVAAMLAAGDLGVLKYMRINVMSRRSLSADKWRAREESMGGGPFIDGGIHWVHLLLTYGGGGAIRLFAQRSPHTEASFPREDTMVVLCQCRNGMVGSLIYSKGIAGTFKRKLHALHGSEGSLYVSNNGLLGIMRGKRRFVRFFPLADRRGFGAMWVDFLDAIQQGAPSLASGLEGARDLAFVEKAYESADSGEVRLLPAPGERV